jgi:hypothetical protein
MTSLLRLRRLWPSVQEHRRVEQEHLRLLHLLLADRYIARSSKPAGTLRYAQKNFFSILFLAIYRAVGVTEERRLFYGTVNHAIRGIVTATDNLLDDEYKELLPLRFAAEATRFKSVMHILLFDRFLFHVVDRAAGGGLIAPQDRSRLQQAILDALVPIGEEEATEEKGVHAILPPEQILKQVHLHKGGNLLRLAFVAPRLVETEFKDRLDLADRGTFRIGMALQSIDDVTDFYDDLRDRRHNYLVSSIRFEGSIAEKTRLEAFLAGRSKPVPIEENYAGSVERVLGRAVQEALAGFDELAAAGFWLNRQQSLALIRYLFRLRGVGHLLPLLTNGLAEVSGEMRQRAAI